MTTNHFDNLPDDLKEHIYSFNRVNVKELKNKLNSQFKFYMSDYIYMNDDDDLDIYNSGATRGCFSSIHGGGPGALLEIILLHDPEMGP